jgi:uncharacterized protein YjbI with pentapeptide repeats
MNIEGNSSTNFSNAYLLYADLTGADLYGADLTDAYLYGADLTGANLGSADLTGANLVSADLTDATWGLRALRCLPGLWLNGAVRWVCRPVVLT